MTHGYLMRQKRAISNVVDGVKLGLMFAAAFSVIASVVFILTGGSAFDRSVATLTRVIAAYVAGGIISGALFGILRPLARWAIGAAMLGIIVAVPAYAGMRFAINGFGLWTMEDTAAVLVLSSLIGGASGVMLRHRLIKRGLWMPH
jgi:hypothetical protein